MMVGYNHLISKLLFIKNDHKISKIILFSLVKTQQNDDVQVTFGLAMVQCLLYHGG